MKFITILLTVLSWTSHAVDFEKLEKELTSTGAIGWIHGSVESRDLFVFTYRNPTDFFDSVQMSLLTKDTNVREQLTILHRHDKVKIIGKFIENHSSQKHIEATSIEVIAKYEPAEKADPYLYEANIPTDLVGKTRANFLVHAIVNAGQILVVEYRDAVLPVYLRNPDFTRDLHKNDIIDMAFTIQRHPEKPTHLRLNERDSEPFKVVESIKALHGKPADGFEGALIMFPKSPDIKFNVFAIQQELPDGLKRQYTLINFDSMEKFEIIRKTLQAAWDKYPGQFSNARNKLVNDRVRVRVVEGKGATYNQVSPSQANPQILLPDVDALQIIEN